jgi:hypothetical protein
MIKQEKSSATHPKSPAALPHDFVRRNLGGDLRRLVKDPESLKDLSKSHGFSYLFFHLSLNDGLMIS